MFIGWLKMRELHITQGLAAGLGMEAQGKRQLIIFHSE
jgi:hypothetical protein